MQYQYTKTLHLRRNLAQSIVNVYIYDISFLIIK